MPFNMPMQDIKKLLKKYIAGKCTPEEQLLIEQWYQQAGDNSKADVSGLPFEQLESSIWQQVQQQTTPQPKRVPMQRTTLLKIAASLLLIIGTGMLIWLPRPAKENWQEVFASKGVPLHFTLDDGSQVWLNAGSGLRYPAHFTGTDRKIELLSGEICLDVKQDPARPFIIKSGQVSTRVLGTIFNVRNYPQLAFLQVTVQQGKVAVQADAQQTAAEVVVLPNEQLTINTASPAVSKTNVDAKAVNGWTSGKLLFNNERLDIIAITLENRYHKKISFASPSLSAYRITAGIEATDSLQEVLEVLCLANKLYYTTAGEHITFRKQPI
ncbi:FecR family protein [Chitinophaga arvensicola]|uniref:Ferric-dicitrate binding protein FerR, regulates iron transport through sigma-19 n=1 Tax=Chitinophaga arvensicola TaxID=29529 RepID=A0A1I0RV04_9BACT|nr:FecR domain-containing protein [Chitinophaga arvensicola]SEW45184.1 ferric-dicitrate binding protein FerR, regulates iron transport through sigma-19 [Chitinophaga arvensicola]